MADKTQIGYLFDETLKIYKERFCLLATILLFFQFIPYTIYNLYNILNPVEVTKDNMWNQFLIHGPLGLVLFMISFIGTVAILYILLKDKKTNTVKEALKGGKKYYLPALGVSLLIFIMLIPLFILLIIPGIIFSIYWMFSQYLIIDRDEKITKSISKSMDIVKGNWWGIFGRLLLIMLIVMAIIFSLMVIMGLTLFLASPASLSTGFEIALTTIGNGIQILVSLFLIIFSTQLYIGYRDKYEEQKIETVKTKTEKTKTQKTKTTKKKITKKTKKK